MGKADKWQDRTKFYFKAHEQVTFLDPRRDDWDSSWKQTLEDDNFVDQVDWELDNLEKCDIMFLYFDPSTKSPISLLEFGLYARSNPEKLICCCPEGFYRKGNLQVTGRKYGVKILDHFETAIDYLKVAIHKKLTDEHN